MTENKLTESEIMKALECCKKRECCECPRVGKFENVFLCYADLTHYSIDLINRKNAEIENVRTQLDRLTIYFDEAVEAKLKTARAEAIKEFANKLKCGVSITSGIITCDDIDQIAKEMGVEL